MAHARCLSLVSILGVVACSLVPVAARADCHSGDSFCVLHVFQGPPDDGEFPEGGLVLDANSNLVGSTFGEVGGQAPTKHCGRSCGNTYGYNGQGVAQSKYFHFFEGGQKDGSFPTDELFVDPSGALYGTTEFGPGSNCGGLGCGTVFRLAADGSEKSYVFCEQANCADGALPHGGVTADPDLQVFYGSTLSGGSGMGWLCGSSIGGCGTVYMATIAKKTLKVPRKALYSFCQQPSCADGANPTGLLALHNGQLYGVTEFGGTNGRGTIFELSPNGDGSWSEQVLYSFCARSACADGAVPEAGLYVDANGNFFGTTTYGGDPRCNDHAGCGVVFELDLANKLTVLHVFQGAPNDGALPRGPVTLDQGGNVYGTTERGGSGAICKQDGTGCGWVFEISPPYTAADYHMLYDFAGPTDGAHPLGAVLLDSQTSPQYLYGVTRNLRTGVNTNCNCGTIYRIKIAAQKRRSSRQPTPE